MERFDFFVERFDLFVEQSDYTVEQSDLEWSDHGAIWLDTVSIILWNSRLVFFMLLQNQELFLIHLNWASVLFLLFVLERPWPTSKSSDVMILGIRCPRNLTTGQRKIYFKHFGSNFVHYSKSFIVCIWDIAAMADKESGSSFYPLFEYCTILKGKSGHERSTFLGL